MGAAEAAGFCASAVVAVRHAAIRKTGTELVNVMGAREAAVVERSRIVATLQP